MLRRLKVRTRLLAVIALPLVLLLAVAAPEVLQRRDRAAEADRAAALAGEAADVAAVVDALQGERTVSSARRAGSVRGIETSLADLRALTDGAVDRAGPALQHLGERAPELAVVTARAASQLTHLADVRSDTDTARSIVPWVDPFAPLVDALLTVQEDLGSLVTDTGVGGELAEVGLLARAKEAAAAQSAQMAAATTWGALRGDQVGILAGLRADEVAYRTAYLAATPPGTRVARRVEVQRGAVTDAGRVIDAVVSDATVEPAGSLTEWLNLGAERQLVLRNVETARAADAVDRAEALGATSRRASTAYAALAGIGLLLALCVALLATRSITRPLRRLTEAADHLAEERLPQLVDALRHPSDVDERFLAATVEPIEVHSDDELAHLGRAFNAVQAVAVDVAAEQAELLRKGISDLYVNLARRNQALIERQIHLLDQLEVGEQDPETLEHLYLLDHLATRMRRNAESLLVLAGAETGPRRSRSVDIVDVVRAAVSEVEDYERVDLGALAAAILHGPAVSDIAHIVAELLENATHFSPPDSTVRIDGARTGGSYQLVITDHGVGIQRDQLDALNAVLRDPPVTGLALGRSLGCLVAARLAARHGITVRLRPGEHEGVAAYVILPRHLIAEDAAEPLPAPSPDTILSLDEAPAGPPAAQRLREALPAGGSFDESLQALLEGAAPPAFVEPPVRAPAPSADVALPPPPPAPRGRPEPERAPLAPPAGAPADATAAVGPRDPSWRAADALPRRSTTRDVPPASVAASSSAPAPDLVSEPDRLVRRVPGATAEVESAAAMAEHVRRSPDEVRALLSRYRSGLQAGRARDGVDGEEGS